MTLSAGRCRPGLWSGLAGLLLCACGSSSSKTTPDAHVATVDAPVAPADAPLVVPDAAKADGTAAPDARPADAAVPDGPLAIDAAPPDARLPDATPADAGPPDAPRPDAPVLGNNEGLVLGSVDQATFVIETAEGRLVFAAQTFCNDVVRGDRVTFTSSPSTGCVTNTFKDQRTNDSCAVYCPTHSSDSGTVIGVTGGGDAFDIDLFSGTKHFLGMPSCSGVSVGDDVTFTTATGSCFSATFIDLISQVKCDVYCP